MFYVILLFVILILMAAALYFFIRSNELSSQLRQAAEAWQQQESVYRSELNKLAAMSISFPTSALSARTFIRSG
jgi:uncharacterized protein HemX